MHQKVLNRYSKTGVQSSLAKRLKNVFRRPRIGVGGDEINALKKSRQKRGESFRGWVTAGGLGSAAQFVATAVIMNPSARVAIAHSLPALAMGVGVGSVLGRSNIRKATEEVGKVLSKEYKNNSNQELIDIVNNHKYVFVDRKGVVVGTNMPRIAGIGRLRLDCKKIKSEKY